MRRKFERYQAFRTYRQVFPLSLRSNSSAFKTSEVRAGSSGPPPLLAKKKVSRARRVQHPRTWSLPPRTATGDSFPFASPASLVTLLSLPASTLRYFKNTTAIAIVAAGTAAAVLRILSHHTLSPFAKRHIREGALRASPISVARVVNTASEAIAATCPLRQRPLIFPSTV